MPWDKIDKDKMKEKYTKRVKNQKVKLLKNAAKGLNNKKAFDPGPSRKNRKRTGPELAMISILREMCIDYEEEFSIQFSNNYKVYDFRILDNVLIEVDGDFVHYNRETIDSNFNAMHLKNRQNDMVKNWIAKNKGFKLIRFWGSTVQHDRELVIEKLQDEISKASS
jgi:very-short-patch-repair endonuclease